MKRYLLEYLILTKVNWMKWKRKIIIVNVIEIGQFDNEKKFNLIYIFEPNSKPDFEELMNNMKQIGVKNFFDELKFKGKDPIILKNNSGNILGYIYQYSEELNRENNVNDSIEGDE